MLSVEREPVTVDGDVYNVIALYLQETAGGNVNLSEPGEQKNGSGEYDPEQNWENMGIQLVKDLLNSSVKEPDDMDGASAESENLFRFYLCDSEEQLKAHVASEKAECRRCKGTS